MTFGSQVDEALAHQMLDLCCDGGIDFIDTANMYNAGRSEEIVGSWLAAQPSRRSKIVLASKVGYAVQGMHSGVDLSPRRIVAECEDSLRRLRTDHLDLYYLHAPDHDTPLESSLETMNGLVVAGKVRAIGMSNFAAWQVALATSVSRDRAWSSPAVVQVMHNLIARDVEVEILPCARHLGLGVCTYNPLAAGLLTGKHQVDEAPPADGRFGTMPRYRDRYWHRAHFDAVAELRALAEAQGLGLLALAFAWSMQRAAVDSVLMGVSSMDQLREILEAAATAPELDSALLEACDRVHRNLRGQPPTIVR
jgi:aryl-alcohol dehydrogenase-like predicted oxidoreductase